jgi:hypothetical protein
MSDGGCFFNEASGFINGQEFSGAEIIRPLSMPDRVALSTMLSDA